MRHERADWGRFEHAVTNATALGANGRLRCVAIARRGAMENRPANRVRCTCVTTLDLNVLSLYFFRPTDELFEVELDLCSCDFCMEGITANLGLFMELLEKTEEPYKGPAIQ